MAQSGESTNPGAALRRVVRGKLCPIFEISLKRGKVASGLLLFGGLVSNEEIKEKKKYAAPKAPRGGAAAVFSRPILKKMPG